MRVLKFQEKFETTKKDSKPETTKNSSHENNNDPTDFSVTESFWDDDDEVLVVTLEAIHAMTTENYNTYLADELRGNRDQKTGVFSWNYPYNKPVLIHHNSRDGEPIGRVIEANYTDNSTIGEPAIVLKAEISDDEAIEKVQDGRYETVSIGGRAEVAECSICGQDWIGEGWCEHWPGEEYDGDICTLNLRDLTFVEISFVNVPADSYARVIDIDESSLEESETEENLEIRNGEILTENMQGGKKMKKQEAKEQIESLKESVEVKGEKIEVLETKVDNLESQKSALESNKESIKEKKEVLETKVENLNSELDSLTEENDKLKNKVHAILAENVVDKKIEMGRLDAETKEEELKEHIDRSEDSLKDTMKDLKKEEEMQKENEEPQSPGEQQDNPGLGNSNEENNVDVGESEEDTNKDEDLFKEYGNLVN